GVGRGGRLGEAVLERVELRREFGVFGGGDVQLFLGFGARAVDRGLAISRRGGGEFVDESRDFRRCNFAKWHRGRRTAPSAVQGSGLTKLGGIRPISASWRGAGPTVSKAPVQVRLSCLPIQQDTHL